jgi:hypothetical protein
LIRKIKPNKPWASFRQPPVKPVAFTPSAHLASDICETEVCDVAALYSISDPVDPV